MRPTLRVVFDQLVVEGRVAAEDEKRLRDVLETQAEEETPWFLQALIGAGAWISTGLFMLFLFLTDLVDGEAAMALLGLLMLGASVGLRWRSSGVFAVQVALAGSFVGQLLLLGATVGVTRDETVPALAGLVLSGVLILIFPDPVHRFLSTVSANCSVAVLLWDQELPWAAEVAYAALVGISVAWWLRRPVLEGLESKLSAPVGHGLAVSLLAASVGIGLLEEGSGLLAPVALGLAVGVVELRLFGIPGRAVDRVVVLSLISTLLLAGVAGRVPGVLAALMLMLLAAHRRSPLLLGEALVAFVYFLGWYYYSLEVTLLQKSVALVLSGGLLLGAWRLLATPWLRRAS